MINLGDLVAELFASAEREVIIVAPFIRSAALARLLEAVPEGVRTKIVTRWRPLDILAGASDLGVYDIAEAQGISLLLRYDLHAKLFVADERCLVGSANVTAAALGWREPRNLELLAAVSRQTAEVREFEATIIATSVPATAAERDQLIDLVARLRDRLGVQKEVLAESEDNSPSLIPPTWVPRASNPEDMYAVYRRDFDEVSRTGLPALQKDLSFLGLAPGMTEEEFNASVAFAIAQAPVVEGALLLIDTTGDVAEPEFVDLLRHVDAEADLPAGSAADLLVVLQRWLSYFMPDGYETAPASIKLIKAKPV